jgi:hypothetical protein
MERGNVGRCTGEGMKENGGEMKEIWSLEGDE